MTRTIQARWVSDPGHAWLEVAVMDIVAVGFYPSPFSYRKHAPNDVALLEEDCDAPRFIHMAESQGYNVEIAGSEEVIESMAPHSNWVRRLGHFPSIEAYQDQRRDWLELMRRSMKRPEFALQS